MRYNAVLLALSLVGSAAVAGDGPLILQGKEGVDYARGPARTALRKGAVVTATATRPVRVPIPKVTLYVDDKVVAGKTGSTNSVSVSHVLASGGPHKLLAVCSGPAAEQKVGASCVVTVSGP